MAEKEVVVLSCSGQVGSGFSEDSFNRALEMHPDVIGCDCGSCDSGPYCLGAGVANKSKTAVKRDLRLMIVGGVKNNIPVLVGSAGTSGGNPHLDWVVGIVKEIAEEENLHFKLAVINAELSKEQLKGYMRQGKVKPLYPAPELSEEKVDGMTRIVGMMGAEPFIKALEGGAQVVIAGRASDVSIFAAVPIMKGFKDHGPTWHASKLLECGAACVVKRTHPDCMVAWIRENSFSVEPPNPNYYCTPVSVVSHALYETSSPFELVEPSGTMLIKDCTYTAESDRRVLVEGSKFKKATQYTIRLEGARFSGYRRVIIGAIRDPLVLGQLEEWTKSAHEETAKKIFESAKLTENKEYRMRLHVIGGAENALPSEVCMMIEVIGDTPEHAKAASGVAWHTVLHYPVKQYSGLQSNLAFPFSPPDIPAGEAYEFCLNHVVEVDDPLELFPISYQEL